ncbi:hypothetical protein [Planococcus wigleyi]|uniref:Nucleic acid-binding protein n=1 Tax=Planococcus wigleyi TaxID=2762216 RepID=A0ABR8WA15_9BACL|nr:hypothetical protein [Planococcus wigleyi]MBD8013849.1 hypothetical protein [Planococcus wigleyi]
MKTCTNCGGNEFNENPANFALSTWERKNSVVTVNLDSFMPVKVENCSKCGQLNLFFDTSEAQKLNE